MTNYGALDILALPRSHGGRMEASEAELRLLIALETFRPNGNGERVVGLRLLAKAAGVDYKTVVRVRDRLLKAGLIEVGSAARSRTAWRLLVPPSDPSRAGISSDPSPGGISPSDPSQGGISRDATDPNAGRNWSQPGWDHALVRDMDNPRPVGEPASRAGAGARADDEAQPDWRRGPGRQTGRAFAQPGRSAERGTPMPANWTGHQKYHPPQEVTDEGAAKVRAAMAAGLAKAGIQPSRVVTDEDKRAEALRQVAAAQAGRGPLPPQEDDLEQPPF